MEKHLQTEEEKALERLEKSPLRAFVKAGLLTTEPLEVLSVKQNEKVA